MAAKKEKKRMEILVCLTYCQTHRSLGNPVKKFVHMPYNNEHTASKGPSEATDQPNVPSWFHWFVAYLVQVGMWRTRCSPAGRWAGMLVHTGGGIHSKRAEGASCQADVWQNS